MIDAHLHLWDKQHGMVDGLPCMTWAADGASLAAWCAR